MHGVVQDDAVAPGVFRPIQRGVGMCQQLAQLVSRRRCRRHAEACRHGRGCGAGVGDDRRNRGAQLLATLTGVCQAAAGQQDAEFLAAEAAEQITGAQMHAASLHGLAQHVVAGRVAVLVVDRFEVIQVAQEHAHFLLRLLIRFELALRLLDEVRPVVDAGEAVDARQLHEVQLRALGAVGEQRDEHRHDDQQRDVQAAGLDGFLAQLLLQLQDLVLLVERIDLQAVRRSFVLGALVGDLPCADVVEVALVGGRVLLVIGEGGLRVALFLRELVQQPIGVHDRLDVLALGTLIGNRAQCELPRGSPIAALAVCVRQHRFVVADHAAIARSARLIVVLAQQLDGIAIAALLDIPARDVRAHRVRSQALADLHARIDAAEELSDLVAQPAAAEQRLQAHVIAATEAAARRILAHDAVSVTDAEVVLADLVVDVPDDRHALLARVLVSNLGQQR